MIVLDSAGPALKQSIPKSNIRAKQIDKNDTDIPAI